MIIINNTLSNLFSELHQDCLIASANQAKVRTSLASKHIAVTGGTGFVG